MEEDRRAVGLLGADGAPALRVPPLPRDVVRRPRLHRLLDESLNTPLTLIAAPAGFGKTTLLGSWAGSRTDITAAWISCDAVDDGPGFWTQLLELVGGESPATRPDSPFDAVFSRLPDLPRPLVVLVDDFHLVRSKHVLGPLARLLAHPPPNVHVVLASRRDPGLPLHRLRLAGRLTELRAKDLAFTSDEAATFFVTAGLDLRPELVSTLLDRTEGWAAALGSQLSRYAPSARRSPSYPRWRAPNRRSASTSSRRCSALNLLGFASSCSVRRSVIASTARSRMT